MTRTETKTIESVVLDKDGYDIARVECDSIKAAKARTRFVLSDAWAKAGETTHAQLGTHKGEVLVNGECVWDSFYKPGK